MKTKMALLALLVLCATAQGDRRKSSKSARLDIPWAHDVRDAKAKALRAKLPIAICFIQKKCRLSMQMVRALHEDGRIYEIKDRFVWLCVDPTRKDVYKWFIRLCGDSLEGTPTFFFLNHKGQYADPALTGIEPATGADPKTILSAFRAVLGRLDKTVGKPEWWAPWRKKVADADACAEKDPAGAIRLYREVVRACIGYPGWDSLEQSCMQGLEKVIQKGMAKVRSVIARKADTAEKIKAFEELQTRFSKTDASAWAAREAKKLQKKK
jgi:hypothetical protein